MAENNLIQPYIKHDDNASQDGKILRMYLEFRKNAKSMSREELESFVAHGAYAIFWRILEFMKSDNLYIDDVELLSDNLRVDSKYINQILNDFELFRVQDGEYISDRLLRDLKRQEEKASKNKKSAETRWLLSDFSKNYEDVFGQKPILDDTEIETLKDYSKKIENFRKILPDIIYTLKFIKFDESIKTKPLCNWLLKGNNLIRVYNGEFGKLKHKKTESEIKQAELQNNQEQIEREKEDEEFLSKMESISNKSEAIAFIAELAVMNPDGTIFENIGAKPLKEKFDITNEELRRFIYEKKS